MRFGLGIVLATQNPVDLDYKGLSNAGTWFLGRSQTERDKERVLEGLEGASNAAGHSFDRRRMDEILSSLANRVFLISNVHADQPVVFQTRWALSTARSLDPRTDPDADGTTQGGSVDMLTLNPASPSPAGAAMATPKSASTPPFTSGPAPSASLAGSPTSRAARLPEFFIPAASNSTPGRRLLHRPAVLGVAGLHHANKKTGMDHRETLGLLAPRRRGAAGRCLGRCRSTHRSRSRALNKTPEPGARFGPLPGALARAKSYAEYTKGLKNYLYRERKRLSASCPELNAYSRPGESQRDSRLRLSQGSREARDRANQELRASTRRSATSYRKTSARRPASGSDREQAQASKAKWDAAVAFGNSVLGAFLGKKTISKTSVGKATSAAKAAGKAMQQSGASWYSPVRA